MPETLARSLSSVSGPAMAHPLSPLSCSGTSLHIQDLRQCMDAAEDGFSQSESEDSHVIDGRSERRQPSAPLLTQTQRTKIASDIINCYDSRVFYVNRQDSEEPIIPNSPLSTNDNSGRDYFSKKSRFSQALAFKFLEGNDPKQCEFGKVKNEDVLNGLSSDHHKAKSHPCYCASYNTNDDVLCGWDVINRSCKHKSAKKSRKASRASSETAFQRLTGYLQDRYDDFEFQHHPDPSRYIEQYRFQHTVGDVCRRAFHIKPTTVRKNVEADPYYSKIKNNICAIASECDILAILSADKDNQSVASSDNSTNNKSKSDEETDDKSFTVKDRGKTLNLAPVRECAVPELSQTESQEQLRQHYLTLNQYLNLVIPPKSGLPNNSLQVSIDEAKDRRYRVANTGDNNLFPACTPRRGARPLRLGSAEFVKPGTPEQFGPPEAKWSGSEKKIQRASTFHTSTVPGSLYVGSTVSRDSYVASASNPSRTTSGGQKKKPTTPQPPPTHQISGKKYKPCERVGELVGTRDRSRYSTRDETASQPSSAPPPSRTTANELRDHYARKQERILSVNVNHLGIRGRTFKPDEHMTILYKFHKDKNRRIAVSPSVKS